MHVFFETRDQGRVVLMMIATGFLAGFLFDFFSLFKSGKGRTAGAIIDIVVFLLTGVFSAAVLAYFNKGQVRYYDVLGLICGGIIYGLLPHRLFVKIGNAMNKFNLKREENKKGEGKRTSKAE